MKAKISIDFKRINGKKVDDKLLKENPKLLDITEQTMIKLCNTIKKYFAEHKIKVGIDFELKNE
jgi:hypothetical protein